MDTTPRFGSVSGPKHSATEFLAYEADCRAALSPLLTRLLDIAELAGWDRRTVASTLMFLAAQQVTADRDPASVRPAASADPTDQERSYS